MRGYLRDVLADVQFWAGWFFLALPFVLIFAYGAGR